MSEEIKTTSDADSVPDKSVVVNSGQGEEQVAQGVEEKEAESDGATVPDEKMVGENEMDAKPADISDDGRVKEEVAGETVPLVEPETGEVAKEESKGKDESQAEGREEIDAKKVGEEDLPANGKRKESSANETEVEMNLNEAEAGDEGGNRKEERQEVKDEKEEEKVEEGAEEKAEKETVEETKEKAEEKAEGNKEENVEGKAEENLSEGGVTNQIESEKEVTEDGGAEENSETKTEENLAEEGEETVVGIEPSLVSSEGVADESGEGVADEEWISWKSEFVNKFNKRLDRKWIISGIGIVVMIVGFVMLFNVPGFRSTDGGEAKSLKEIAGPVYDMKFFLPLDTGSGKTRFVKLSVAIELMDGDYRREIDKRISDLREEVINLVLTKSPKEVRSSEGKEILKNAITNSLNKHFSKDCIKNTYFTELVVL